MVNHAANGTLVDRLKGTVGDFARRLMRNISVHFQLRAMMLLTFLVLISDCYLGVDVPELEKGVFLELVLPTFTSPQEQILTF